MEKTKDLVIFGTSAFAAVAYEYFTHDSPYRVVAFTVTRDFLTEKTFMGLPVVPFEDIQTSHPPEKFHMFVALVYMELNRRREKFYALAKQKGYTLASYISSHAFVWRNAKLGEHVFIFEDNTVQPFTEIGDNTVLWSGNHIGHHSVIGNHVFVSSHVVVSGYCTVGDHSFLGVNSCMNDRITIAPDCIIGSGTNVIKNTQTGQVVVGNPGKPLEKSSYDAMGVTAP